MFSTKGLFAQIPCPHLQECHLPQCIFSHSTSDAVTPSVVSLAETTSNDNQEVIGRYKRRKLDGAAGTEDAVVESSKTSTSQKLYSVKPTPTPTSKSLAALQRPISPPPIKRRAHVSIPEPQRLVPSPQPIVRQNVPKQVLEASATAETLNPRNLKGSAPAAYDLRMRLIKALHEHFHRLNTELKKDASAEEEKLVLSDQALIKKTLDIEEDAATQPPIYTNIVKNKILAYKRMGVKQWVEERQKDVAAEESKQAILTAHGAKPNEAPKLLDTGLSTEDEITLLEEIYTPVTHLQQHGYVTSIPTYSDIEKARSGVEAAQGWEVCDRCKTRFQVFPERREEDGAHASGGICTYHYGKPLYQVVSSNDAKVKREKRYRCCGEAMGDSLGCTQAENHVFKISEVKRMSSVLNFVKTPENAQKMTKRPVCIDGEMGYTVYGLELIRLTATSWPSGDELFDVLVRPLGGVLDLNSRYSGVWPADFANALPYSEPTTNVSTETENRSEKKKLKMVPSPQAARDLLFSHLSPQTPLIGHGLENDLNAIRIIHPVLIDTALLFPHKAGLPFRNALKALMAQHLNRQIQVVVDGKMEGHDSKEDANAAGDLVRLKLKWKWTQLKSEGYTFRDGILTMPRSKMKSDGDGSKPSETTEHTPCLPSVLTGPKKRNRGAID